MTDTPIQPAVGPPSAPRKIRPALIIVVVVVASVLVAAAVGGSLLLRPKAGLPGSLYGSWAPPTTSNSTSTTITGVHFSDGGRISIGYGGGSCEGEYMVTAIDGNHGTLASGYLPCKPLMDGYLSHVDIVVNGDSLVATGAVLGGSSGTTTYHRNGS